MDKAACVFIAGVTFLCLTTCIFAQSQIDSEWLFLDNGQIRLGVKRNSGAGIGWFSKSGSDRNLVNHWDHGRLIQQSYYGAKDGSLWNKKPWRWNPVQGGDWQGSPAKVIELTSTKTQLHSRSTGKHWASGEDLEDVEFEQTIQLQNQVAHIHFKMTYTGTTKHPERHQELPAVFMAPDLMTLVHYTGKHPWTSQKLTRSIPGWPNESRSIDEHWAAYVDGNDFGLGVYVPIADQITCYRFGDGNPEHGSCSYFAPVKTFAIEPGMVFEYDVYLSLGTTTEIRDRFKQLNAN